MQNMKIGARLISFVLTLSILLSAFSIFAFAQESDGNGVSDSELSVAFNRTFSEGWNYDNGISDVLAKGNSVGLAYEYRDTGYNYYLRLDKQNTNVAYLAINTDDSLATSGKTFIELDLTSGGSCTMGQALRVSVQGDIKTLVEFKDDGMYVLGKNVGTSVYALKWESLGFVFDFDYVSRETQDTCYKVSAYHEGALLTEKVFEYGVGGRGISQVRFVFGDVQEKNVGAWYGVDNLKIYSGVDEFTAIASSNNGLAVDATLPKDFVLAGSVADPDGFLRGEPTVDRLDGVGTALIHYNRHFGEGWTLTNGGSVLDKGNNVDIRSEKQANGEYNYFFRYRAMNTQGGYFDVPIKSAPTDTAVYLEFDLKAGVNASLGGIMQLRGSTGESLYALSLDKGQLSIFGTAVGYVGVDWVHIIMAIDNETNADGKYTATVYFGKNGVMDVEYNTDGGFSNLTAVRFGSAIGGTEEKYGDWFAVDNLAIYSGTKSLITLPEDNLGLGVDPTLPQDFPLRDAGAEEAPLDPTPDDMGSSGSDLTTSINSEIILQGAPDLERVDLDPDTHWLRYNRHYGEGWGFGIGGGTHASALMKLEAEQSLDLSYNYYQYYEATTTTNAFWTLSGGTTYPTEGSMFLEFDIKAVEGCDVGGLIQIRTAQGSNNNYLVSLEDGYLVSYATSTTGVKLGKISEDEWCHVAVEFDFDYAAEHPDDESAQTKYAINMWVGDQNFYTSLKSCGGIFGVTGFRIGFQSAPTDTFGQFWKMDNLQLYGGTKTFANIPADSYGDLINPTTEKDFPIQSGSISIDEMVEDSLFMKVGSEYGLVNNERTPNYARNLNEEGGEDVMVCPTLIGDDVWVPLDVILNFLSCPIYEHEDGMSFDITSGTAVTYITIGRNTAVVSGEKVNLTAAPAIVTDKLGNQFLGLTLDDVALLFPDYYIGLDDMNMIGFGAHKTVTTGEINESLRIDIMEKFIFDFIDAEEFYNRVSTYTNNFDHPYLIANQARFDELAAEFEKGVLAHDDDPTNDVEYDETLWIYIRSIISTAVSNYNKYSAAAGKITFSKETGILSTGKYEGLSERALIYDNETTSDGLQHSYQASAGYDPIGGRLYTPYQGLEALGYAYQVTGDIRFAQLAYDWCNELVDWDHWGPGHFLNAADTAEGVAICYDWCYDAWVELNLDVDKIADGIFYHGTLQGYLVSIGQPDPHGRAGGNGSTYTKMVNNWNPVCTQGVACAALATMNYTGFGANTKLQQDKARLRAEAGYEGEEITRVSCEVLAMNFKTLVGAGLEIYAPDGSYEESVSYWGYGANNLFRYCQILESSMGTDLGLMDTWGIDRTAYSIMHMVSSDFLTFTYNDTSAHPDSGHGCSSGEFNYIAQSVGDDFIRLVRQMHINDGGMGISISDSIFYKPVDKDAPMEMPLEYHHVGIHGYTVRSSWDKGAIFAGLLGGDNDDGHGHIDAGQWVYYYKDICFIDDIGSDGYNTYNYFNNNHMYRTTVEGHNVICVTSDQTALPAGQLRSSVSPVIKTGDNEHGAFVIVDTLPAFGNTLISSKRGMLFTNDRKTVIIQDEIVPNGNQTMYWLAHYMTDYITKVEITNGGRTAYMTSKRSTDGKAYVLRLNIITQTPGITFEKMTAYDFLLDATMPPEGPGSSQSYGKNPESDRSNIFKLAVCFDNLMTIDFAVAVEVVDPADPIATGYRWTRMDEWEPYADTRTTISDSTGDKVEEVVTERGNANVSDLIGYVARIEKLFSEGSQYDKLGDFYAAITQITYTITQRGRDYFESNDRFLESLTSYDEYLAIYDAYIGDIARTTGSVFSIMEQLSAYKPKADVEAE